MQRRMASAVALIILVLGELSLALNVRLAEASGTIYIRADGSIDGTIYIQTADNVTYIFAANINDSIIVERNNIIIDGNGYTLQGTQAPYSNGIDLSERTNVTVQNMQIIAFDAGVWLDSSSNTISGNNITNNWYGIMLSGSSNTISGNNITNDNVGIMLWGSSNTISGNNITNNYLDGILLFSSNYNVISYNIIFGNKTSILYYGIGIELVSSSNNIISGNNITNNYSDGIDLSGGSSNNTISGNNIQSNYGGGVDLSGSSNNTISGNNITNNWYGIGLLSEWHGIETYSSSNNTISENNVTNNEYGIVLEGENEGSQQGSSNNKIFHNSFVNNARQVYDSSWGGPGVAPSINAWDDSYPSGGNYWSDYSGVDEKSGPNQDQPGGDGMGDTPYIIDSDNADHYPLMHLFPWLGTHVHDVAVTNITASRTWLYQGFSASVNVTVLNKGDYFESVTVILYYNITANEIAGTQDVSLPSGQNQTIVFEWDTTGVEYCHNYTITAVATIAADNYLADNILADGGVKVRILGDVDESGRVDMVDLWTVGGAYGARPNTPRWDPDLDLDQSLLIDMRDLWIVAKNFGKSC